jgi:AAA15 family ATPase/GTPase
MDHPLGQHPGTTWHKCDFQCHTPRDRNWSGSAALPGGTPEAEEARLAWAREFIAACQANDLLAVAITDHHDICLAQYVMDAAVEADSPLLIFPGVEITCSDNAQCLVIFDPLISAEVRKGLLTLAGNIAAADLNAAQTCVVQPARETIAELVKRVAEEATLKDSTVVLPHFSHQDAHKSLNEQGHHPRFASLTVEGVYIERPYSDLDSVTLDKVYGRIDHWGTRRRAIVATGDNRSAAWDRLGIHECWIKLGEHSVEAVRQAMLADEARITYTRPLTPSERIVSLIVKSSLTGADPVCIIFNAGFNAIIGGRGSGKSAFLEYLRFGLGRTLRDFGDSKDEDDRDVLLIQQTLSAGGYVEINLEREGVQERWKRTLASKDSIEIISGSRTLQITTKAARERFRARGFRQKGLSSTMNDPATASDQITNIAAAEEVDRRREIEQTITNTQREVTTAVQNLAGYWQARVQYNQAKQRVDDLKERIDAIAKRLEAEGVSPAHMQTIEAAPKYSRALTYLEQMNETVVAELNDLEAGKSAVLPTWLIEYDGIAEFDELAALDKIASSTRDQITANIERSKQALHKLQEARETATASFEARRVKFDEEYSLAAAEQAKHSALLDDSGRLTHELQIAEGQVSRLRAAATTKEGAIKAYDDAITKLDTQVESRHQILKSAADKVEDKSSNLLSARVKKDRQPKDFIAALCKLFEGSGTQQVEESCADWVSAVCAMEPAIEGWSALRKALLKLYGQKIEAGSPVEPNDELTESIKAFVFGGTRNVTVRQTKKIYNNLTDATVEAIVSAIPRDAIQLNYIDEGKKIDFKIASPGQQASALLELLLRQSAGTLIIDQPEDDLDNRVIMRIVELLRTSKSTRQLIFTTHNSNVVVNGDADKVIALKSSDPSATPNVTAPRVQLDCDGAIETKAMRLAITSIMEGGREAFDLRGRKYGFE